MIGVKKDFDESLGEGDVATFEAIAVAPDGARVPRKGVAWSLYKIDNDYQWYNADGRWSYEPVKSSQRIADGTIDIGADAPGQDLRAGRLGPRTGSRSNRPTARRPASRFDVGWSGTASADTPDNVVVTLDKTNYAPGDEAKLRIASRFAGKATVALVGDKLERFVDVDLVDGRQCRAVQGRRRLGRGRLRGRADPSPARRQGQAHARPRAGARLVRHRRAPRASSTSRSTRRRWRGRARR